MAAIPGLIAAIDTFIDRLGRITAWTSFVLVLVMATNVLLRYLFSRGSVWAQELEWHLLAPISLLGMSYALRHGEHVRVDILYAKFSERQRIVLDLITACFAVLVCAIVIKLSVTYVLQSYGQSEGSANPGGIPYRYALKSLIPIGFFLFLLQSIAEALRSFLRMREPPAALAT